MKDTPQVRKCILKIATYYVDKMKLKQDRIPDIFFDGIKLPQKKHSIFDSDDHCAQYVYGDIALIHMDLSAHRSVKQLVNSIVHELVHLKNPKLRHGKKFIEIMNSIICECDDK